MSRKVKLLLIVSLLANIALMGVLAGHLGKRMHWEPQQHDKHMAEVISLLPEEKRAEYGQRMTQLQEQQLQAFPQMRQLRKESMEILTAEHFDPAAYQAKTEELQALRSQMKGGMAQFVQELASEMTQEQRQELSKALRFRPHRSKKH